MAGAGLWRARRHDAKSKAWIRWQQQRLVGAEADDVKPNNGAFWPMSLTCLLFFPIITPGGRRKSTCRKSQPNVLISGDSKADVKSDKRITAQEN
nr:hypothetical protein Iba_chr09aCG12850 [Ipomoea batatas]GMD37767.1 hypothetical protein Iba_chr09eCG12550 [Ipomoea batatas]